MRLLLALIHILPRRLLAAWMAGVAELLYLFGVRRRIALENLARAFPEKTERERRALARAHYRHLGYCAADFLRSPMMSDAELEAMVSPDDWEKIAPYLAARRGFVVATAHFGNFELLGVWAARRGAPLAILTRKLEGKFNANWVKNRALAGIREIHSGYANLFDAVERGDAMAILIDQNMIPKRALFVPFFGTLAATTPAPARVAEQTGAPVFLGFAVRDPGGERPYRLVLEGPFHFPENPPDREAAIEAFTARLNDRFEAQVRRAPEQWFWVHRRWKTRPSPSLALTGGESPG